MLFRSDKEKQSSENTYIIVGLGNPGKKYDNTRHNMGFMAVDYLAEEMKVSINKIKHQSLIAETRVGNKKVVLAKPQTFMNLSGNSVAALVKFYKIPIENLIVIYDDIDIGFKELRIREKGSAGTHNGMRSIVSSLGKTEFPRVRMGIGKDDVIPLYEFVLSKFSKADLKSMEIFLKSAGEAAVEIIENDINKAMSRFNGKY